MSENEPPESGGKCPFHMMSRRNFLKGAGGLGVLAAAAGLGAFGEKVTGVLDGGSRKAVVPFWNENGQQSGIKTPQQSNTYFRSF